MALVVWGLIGHHYLQFISSLQIASCSCLHRFSDSPSVLFILSPSLDGLQLQWDGGRCNSFGQTLILSFSFPAVTWFVDITVLILSLLWWMLGGRGEVGETGEHQISLRTEPNALFKSYLSILYPYACVLWGGAVNSWLDIIWNAVHIPGNKESAVWIQRA